MENYKSLLVGVFSGLATTLIWAFLIGNWPGLSNYLVFKSKPRCSILKDDPNYKEYPDIPPNGFYKVPWEIEISGADSSEVFIYYNDEGLVEEGSLTGVDEESTSVDYISGVAEKGINGLLIKTKKSKSNFKLNLIIHNYEKPEGEGCESFSIRY